MVKVFVVEEAVGGVTYEPKLYLDEKDARKCFEQILQGMKDNDNEVKVFNLNSKDNSLISTQAEVNGGDRTVRLYTSNLRESRQATVTNQYDPNEMAQAMSRFVNGSHRDDVVQFVEEMMKDHRTLLQSKMNIAFRMIAAAAQAYKNKNYDARNEYSFKLANQMFDALSTGDDGENNRYHPLNMGVPLI